MSSVANMVVENVLYKKTESFWMAALSIIDMWFDIIMIVKYHRSGKQGFATATTVSVSVCLGAQFVFCYGQNKNRTW